ncbi:MAG: guanylate kinase [Eubacteriaceae bacterium]|jgi:guanylate kinase|nr:guanylate kinase [Eubacteriaceae bacterium]
MTAQKEEQFFKKEKGCLIVISGPSCAGKGTVTEIVHQHCPDIKFSVSETTRKPRPMEKEGVDYFYQSVENFEKRIEENMYLEYAKVHGNYYGTPRDYVEKMIDGGYDVILEIDIQGAAQIRKTFKKAVYIFIAPPSMEELRRRIHSRGTETKEEMERRLSCAYEEMTNADDYSYIVINENKETAARQVRAIITAEKCRTERLINHVLEILKR